MEVLPVTAQRILGWRWRAGSLPALVALLLAVVCGTGVITSQDGPTTAASGSAALGSAVTPAHPAAGAARADVRLLAKRSGQWMSGRVVAAGPVLVFRLVPPVGWWVSASVAAGCAWAVRGEVYRGRAPPLSV